MAIEFPKFPNDRRKSTSKVAPSKAQFSAVPTDSNTTHGEEDFSSMANSSEGISQERLGELKSLVIEKKAKSKPKPNKLLFLVLAVVLVGGIGAYAFSLYQKSVEPPQATANPKPALSTTGPTSPVAASSSAVTTSVTSSNVATTEVAPPIPPETTSPPPVTAEGTTHGVNQDDLQKPILNDATTTTAKPTSNAPPVPIKEKSEVVATNTTTPNTEANKSNSVSPTPNKNGLSYDEFVKTSDNSLFIEPPAKHK